MCLELITVDGITNQKSIRSPPKKKNSQENFPSLRSYWLPSSSSWGGTLWNFSHPCCHVNWNWLVLAAALLRIHGSSFSITYKRYYLAVQFLYTFKINLNFYTKYSKHNISIYRQVVKLLILWSTSHRVTRLWQREVTSPYVRETLHTVGLEVKRNHPLILIMAEPIFIPTNSTKNAFSPVSGSCCFWWELHSTYPKRFDAISLLSWFAFPLCAVILNIFSCIWRSLLHLLGRDVHSGPFVHWKRYML